MRKVLANTTPLIALANIDRLDLLKITDKVLHLSRSVKII